MSRNKYTMAGQTTREVTAEGLKRPSTVYCTAPTPDEEAVIGLEALYSSSCRCLAGVDYKYSAQDFTLHRIEKILNLHDAFIRGIYKEGPTYIVNITYPKKRTALSITFTDRVVQRSFNDNILYPTMTTAFIGTNFACQKGKGTDAAREYYKKMCRRAFINNNHSNDFVVITLDIKGYYDSMVHEITNAMFANKLPKWSANFCITTLDHQYKGETGYNPGSQMVQIAGISYLNPFDHFAKEVLHLKYYLRYMDDIHILSRRDEAEGIIERCREELASFGLTLHPTKTKIIEANDGAIFLGYRMRTTHTGKVLMLRNPARVKDNRRKLRRLAKLVIQGKRDIKAFDDSWQCIEHNIKEGDSHKLLRGMRMYVSELRKEIQNEMSNLSAVAA